MDYQLKLKEIRQACRLAMNGDASASMRKYGLTYKLNFGLMISQIKTISDRYTADSQLATLLWEQDTRELKIMATFLFPVDEFSVELANKWILEISNQEIREQLTKNLLQNLPFAESCVTNWVKNPNFFIRTTGYWLLARLLLSKKRQQIEFLDQAPFIWEDALNEDFVLRNSALLALKQIGRMSKILAENILARIAQIETNNKLIYEEVTESLSFEFDFFFNN